MIFNVKLVLLALVSVVAAQSSSSDTSAPGSSSSSSSPSSAASSAASSTSSLTSSSPANVTSTISGAFPSGTPAGLTACILECVSTAAIQSECVSFTNLTCVCTSTAFQSAATSCLMANCTQADVTAATNLQMTQCAAVNGSSGASSMASNTASNTASGSGTPIAPPPTGASDMTSPAPSPTAPNGAHMSAASGIWAFAAGLMVIAAAAL